MIDNSGIGTVLKNLIPRFLGWDGCNVRLMGKAGALGKFEWMDPGILIPTRSEIYSIREQAEIPMKVPDCDFFWCPHFNVPLLPIKAKRRLTTICDAYHLAHSKSLSLSQRTYARLLFKAASRLSDRIVTISGFSAGELMERAGVGAEKLHIIPCGADPGFASGAGKDPGLGAYFLFVGNVKPHKNLVGALSAFFRFAESNQDFKFVIVGKKEGFINGDPEVARMASSKWMGQVIFTGFVDDAMLKAYYKYASALVFPSFYEGFGLPILEAMAFGIPIISSNKASMPEVGGDAVMYFDPAQGDEILRAFETVASGRLKPDSEKYAARLRRFTWDNCFEAYRENILEMADF